MYINNEPVLHPIPFNEGLKFTKVLKCTWRILVLSSRSLSSIFYKTIFRLSCGVVDSVDNCWNLWRHFLMSSLQINNQYLYLNQYIFISKISSLLFTVCGAPSVELESIKDRPEDELPSYIDTQLPGYTTTQLPIYIDTQLPSNTNAQLPSYIDTQLPNYPINQSPSYKDGCPPPSYISHCWKCKTKLKIKPWTHIIYCMCWSTTVKCMQYSNKEHRYPADVFQELFSL